MTRLLVVTFAATLALSGCASSDAPPTSAPTTASTTNIATPSESMTSAPTRMVDQEYDRLTDLRDAAVAAGYECSAWHEDTSSDRMSEALESGYCRSGDRMAIYLDTTNRDASVKSYRSLDVVPVLVGPNWTIAAILDDDLDPLQEALGGRIQHVD